MQAWNFEADQIQTDDLLKKSDIVTNEAIDEFLSNKNEQTKFFLVAPKGLGKTLILKLKSKSIRKDAVSSFICIPEGELVEKVEIQPISLSIENFSLFEKLSTWLHVWKVCLTLTICKYLEVNLPSSFEKKLSKAKDISQILNIILNDWKFFLHQSNLEFHNEIAPNLRDIRSQIAIFIDSFDQTLGQFLNGYTKHNKDTNKNKSIINLWTNAQLGLLYAISEICIQHRHLKIYASIRLEAFEMDDCDLHLQMEDFTTKVSYSKDQLKQIFIINIEKTEKSKLFTPNEQNPFVRFIGFDKIPHFFVPHFIEDIFDFMYRHTFGRPRELVLIGRRINDIKIEDRNIKSIREKVNSLSYNDIFDQFKKEVIPNFDVDRLVIFLRQLRYNVFSREEAKHLDKELLQYYYKLGLIGIAKKQYITKGYLQEFREAFKFNYKKTVFLPDSPYFFTHPSMDDLLTTQLDKKYHTSNVIGFNYEFTFPKKKNKEAVTCCHFGVGKLGIGLVIPYLHKIGCRIALINRISADWQPFIQSEINEVIILDANGDEIKFSIIHDLLNTEKVKSIIDNWELQKINHIFLLTENPQILKSVLKDTDIITTALKYKPALKWCSEILKNSSFKKRIYLYPFENDRTMVDFFRKQISQSSELYLKEVIADRICTRRTIKVENNKGLIHSDNERYCSVVINDSRKTNPFNSMKLLKGLEIILTDSLKEFNFYHTRKFWLFNCTHAILSCIIYNHLKVKGIPIRDWETTYINIFDDSLAIRKEIELITQAEILQIILGLEITVKSKIFPSYSDKEIYMDLFSYSQNALDRMFAKRDQLIRVLPLIEFTSKYESRIKELIDFYNNDKYYQSTKKTNVFEDENKYKAIRKSIFGLQSNLLNLSIVILKNNNGSIQQQGIAHAANHGFIEK